MLFVIYHAMCFALNLCAQPGLSLSIKHRDADIAGLSLHMSYATFMTYNNLLTEMEMKGGRQFGKMYCS